MNMINDCSILPQCTSLCFPSSHPGFFLFRGQMLCNMGDVLNSELDSCLPIFLDRLKNEITRLTAVKAVTSIAG